MFSEVAEIVTESFRDSGTISATLKTRVILILNFSCPHAIPYTKCEQAFGISQGLEGHGRAHPQGNLVRVYLQIYAVNGVPVFASVLDLHLYRRCIGFTRLKHQPYSKSTCPFLSGECFLQYRAQSSAEVITPIFT